MRVRVRLSARLPATLVVILFAWAANAAPSVFFEPAQVMVQPGQEFELSFRVDDCGDSVASYQLYLSFDHELVELVEATEGSLYSESGLMTWFIEEEEGPGFWHFFDTVFGAGTFVAPPGELLHLTFRGLPGAVGYSQARVDTIRMTDRLRDPLPICAFEHADIFVAGTGIAGSPSSLGLGPASPNPFSNGTAIPFSIQGASVASRASVYDVSGRLVRRLRVPSGARVGELEWDGTSDDGTATAPGVYLVALECCDRGARTKVVKLR